MAQNYHAVSILTSDGLGAGRATLGEEFPEAFGAVGLIVPTGESLPCQGLLAVSAGEALPVPGFVPVGHTSLSDYL